MKRNVYLSVVILATMLLVMIAPVLAQESVLTGAPDEEYYMISFLSGIDYWKTCFQGFEDSARNHGVKVFYTGQRDRKSVV